MNKTLINNIFSYIIIASIFVTGAGFEGSIFKFYWYYPFYIIFLITGLLVFRKVEFKPFLVLIAIIIFSLLTYQSNLLLVVKQIVNISFSWVVFYYFICLEKHDIIKLFEKYVKFAKVLAVLGLIQVLLFSIGLGNFFLWAFPWLKDYQVSNRLQSLTQEPSYIAFTFAPIVFIAIHNLFYRKRHFMNRGWSFLFILCYMLTLSSIAYFGLLLMLVMAYFKNFTYFKLQLIGFAFLGIFLLGFTAYKNLPGVKMRVDDTLLGLSGDFFEGERYRRVNPSTYAFLSNYYVTTKAFWDHPIVGNGLGTYEAVYDRNIPSKIEKVSPTYRSLNRQDGASMAFRLLSETGLVGLLLFTFYLFRNKLRMRMSFSKDAEVLWVLNTGIFIVIILALLRNGNYTIHGKLLFFFLYYYSYEQVKAYFRKDKELPKAIINT